MSNRITKENFNMKTTICPVCRKEISNCNYERHLISHKNNPKYHNKLQTRQSIDHDDLYCKYCGKLCKNKNSLAQHECRCDKNPNKIATKAWNKGATKETDSRVLTSKVAEANKQKGYKHYQEYLKDNSIAWGIRNMKQYKKYFLEEQEHCCAICGMKDEWNGKHLIFVLDHIDGDASNNRRDNLRMICPNCDSQLPTFKSKNKNSARRNYWKEHIIKQLSDSI